MQLSKLESEQKNGSGAKGRRLAKVNSKALGNESDKIVSTAQLTRANQRLATEALKLSDEVIQEIAESFSEHREPQEIDCGTPNEEQGKSLTHSDR